MRRESPPREIAMHGSSDLLKAVVSGALSLVIAVGLSYLAGRATRKKSNGKGLTDAQHQPHWLPGGTDKLIGRPRQGNAPSGQ